MPTENIADLALLRRGGSGALPERVGHRDRYMPATFPQTTYVLTSWTDVWPRPQRMVTITSHSIDDRATSRCPDRLTGVTSSWHQ